MDVSKQVYLALTLFGKLQKENYKESSIYKKVISEELIL